MRVQNVNVTQLVDLMKQNGAECLAEIATYAKDPDPEIRDGALFVLRKAKAVIEANITKMEAVDDPTSQQVEEALRAAVALNNALVSSVETIRQFKADRVAGGRFNLDAFDGGDVIH
jgi:hypothetical protein